MPSQRLKKATLIAFKNLWDMNKDSLCGPPVRFTAPAEMTGMQRTQVPGNSGTRMRKTN